MSWSLRNGLVCLSIVLTIGAQAGGSDPVDAKGWFMQARDRFNLRTADAAPFHLRVTFHAYPGIEVQKKTAIVAGDGIYDEVWMSPQQWRREVTLGDYHAVEALSDRQRKLQASSDYEPSRVLMLMEALLDPVPRNLVEPELNDIPLGWKVEHRTAGSLAYVSLSRRWTTQSNTFGFRYLLLPAGLLVQSDQAGLLTEWQDEVSFAGRNVPRRITVRAGERVLLSADVTVEAAGGVAPETFGLPGTTAEPGMTLRPLHTYETHGPELLNPEFSFIGGGHSTSRLVMRQIIDRHGVGQELEVIAASPGSDLEGMADGFRHIRWRPATVDRTACEIAHMWFH